MNLYDLAAKYQTDKLEHGYVPFYEATLPKNPKKLLEIGVLRGSSIKMWRDYFPGTEIHGLDLFVENDMSEVYEDIMKSVVHEYDVKLHKGNQCDWLLLEQLRKENFDIIIDDGSHNSRDQLITFFGLFDGNHYYIEDLQCAEEEFYRQGLPLPLTAKFVFDHFSGRYSANYDCQSPIVLIQSV